MVNHTERAAESLKRIRTTEALKMEIDVRDLWYLNTGCQFGLNAPLDVKAELGSQYHF